MMIAGPDVKARGSACRRLTEFLDLYPTLADMCGLKGTPTNLHGKSLRPLLGDPQMKWDKPSVTQVRRGNNQKAVMGYTLRTPQYRYTMWGDGTQGEEMYNYQADPREMNNLAKNGGGGEIKAAMRKQLDAVLKTRGKGREAAAALRTAQREEIDAVSD
jgi:arylsulfatase A-like enzyme